MTRSTMVAVALLVLGSLGISRVQPGLAASVHHARRGSDVFVLPPPAELRAMTFGYRATAADLLWADLVLEYGLHWQEHRRFPDITRYADGILALEPRYKQLYMYIDTMILFAPGGAGPEEARVTRKYLERGTVELPYDPDIWLKYSQYIAFLAASFLKDDAEIDRWRKEGALALAHSVELGADPSRALAASSMLDRAGEHEAAVAFVQRAYALAEDNPEVQRQLLFRLAKLNASFDSEQAVSAVEHEWRARYPFLTRGESLLIGPARSPTACAGPSSYEREGCARDWQGFIAARR